LINDKDIENILKDFSKALLLKKWVEPKDKEKDNYI
jgi:hypothetical protein